MTPTQRTPSLLRLNSSRRAFLGLAAATALVPITVSGGAAHAGRGRGPAPETVPLPDGFRPEGITSGPGTTYYAGSMANGSIVTGDLLRSSQSVLLPASTGRMIRGLYFDCRSGILWFVGNVGSVQWVWGLHTRSRALVFAQSVPDGGFHNDLVVTRSFLYATDSRRDRLVRVPLDPRTGRPAGAISYLPLTGAWPAGDGVANNANGIRDLPDGTLVLNNSRVGGLWQVDPATGVTVQIPVKGGPGITGGDGLERDGHVLYNVRGSGQNEVSVLLLSKSRSGWTAKWAGARTDSTLDVPSTATVAGRWLWVINARFSTPPTPTTPYYITRLPAR